MNQKTKTHLVVLHLVLIGSFVGKGTAAVTMISREATSSNQTISSGALDFSVNSSTILVEKNGGPVDWTYGSGAIYDGNSPQSITWTDGSPVASGTSNTATYFPLGPSFGAQQVSSGTISFVVNQTLPTPIELALYTLPNGNTQEITYDYAVLVNNTVQFSQSGNSDSQLDLEIFKFRISDLAQGDEVTFRVDNVSGSNGFHNFAFLGAEINSVPEPSAFALLAGAALAFTGLRRRQTK